MKREEVLARLGYTVPQFKKKRVIVHSDVKNEADDHFAIMHHLLTPSHDVVGIIAAHFEGKVRIMQSFLQQSGAAPGTLRETLIERGTSMQMSLDEGRKLLALAGIDDVPLLAGSAYELSDTENLPESEGADFIIREALREDDAPLYIAMLGSLTDLAIALLKKPEIATRLTAIWIGGGEYPNGGDEFNLAQDIQAANVVFGSAMPLWQVPKSTYKLMEVSFAELVKNVRPCGEVGAYLCQQMFDENDRMGRIARGMSFPHGESWCLGDNPTVSVLLQSEQRECWHMEKAPIIRGDMSYQPNPEGKPVRVYDTVDARLTLHDLFAKLQLCYG